MSKTEYKITTARLSLIGSLSLVGMTVLSGMILSSSIVSAEDNISVVDKINITVPLSCSLSGTGMTSHTATIENGRYVSDIGTTTLKAFCNDNNGFAIYATGYTGDVIGQENSNKLVGTPSTIGNISTGTATSGDTSNWSMKLAATSTPTPTYPITIDNSFNAYKEVPNEYTKVAHRDSSTDTGENAEGATLISTYASYISKTQAAGAYSGKVIYTLVHPSNEEPPHEVACEAGKICYNPNTTTGLGQMGRQTKTDYTGFNNITDGSSVELWAPNFKRTGYGFAGWNTAYDYSGTNYGPNQTITAPADVETNGLSLYAVWIKSAGSLQNWVGCDSLAQGATTALTDERDSNTYAVAKLADGKCWTIENLRLDNTPELSSANTHDPSLPITNIYNADPAQATSSNHLSSTTDPTQTAWCTSNSSACDDQSMLATNNTTLFTNNTTSSYIASSNVYSYGNYYNWYSATAGNGTYSKSSGNVSGDICPAGWHLPTGGSASAEFGALDVAMGGTGENQFVPYGETASQLAKWRSYPNNFVYSGGVYGSSVYSRGSYGIYWSSSTISSSNAYFLYMGSNMDSSVIGPMYHNSIYEGKTVRCIADV